MSKQKLLNRKIMDKFPKVELHRHIEGSFCLDTLFDVAMKNNIENVSKNKESFKKDAQFPRGHKPDFKLFLSKFRNDWYDSHEDVYNVIYNSVKNFKEEHLFFLELRFSPEHFSLKNDFDRVDITKIVVEAGKKAAKEIDLEIKFLITFNRNKQIEDEMLNLYKKLQAAKLTDLVGMDLAGNEEINPPEEFVNFFDAVHSDGTGITIHAGEVTPPEQVWAAIDLLHATRVGHGTATIKDEKLQRAVKERDIYLEQCPVSNYFTGSFVDTPNHPFRELNKKGIKVTLNSDDPTIQDTTLTDDFITALTHYDISYQELIDLNIRSLEGSFVSPSHKAALIKAYKEKVKKFEEENEI